MKFSRIFIIGFTLSLLTFLVSNHFGISYAATTSLTHENSRFKTSISTSDFSQKYNPQISIEEKLQVSSGFLKLIPKFIYSPPAPKALISTLKVTIKNANGTTLDFIQPKIEEIDGKISVSLDKNQLKPGKYSFEISSDGGNTITQDFTWGVLSLNPDQSSYGIGDTAFLAMAVLDEHGDMVCDSALTLVITKPDGTTATLSTQNGQITVNDVCHTKEVTLIPDYQALFNIDQIGNYNYTLTANTQNGTYSISDSFIAQNNPDFVIKRLAITRIYPPNTYPVTLKITANNDFTGTITESVPYSFKITDTSAKITLLNDRKFLSWAVSLSKGQTTSLKYSYLAPMISPERYLLGPLVFTQNNKTVFTEPRSWQIASDATASKSYAFASTAEGWTGVTGANTAYAYSSGTIQSTVSGRNKSNSSAGWEISGITWEDLGVPANSIITAVDGSYDWQCSTYSTGAASNSGALTLTDASDGNSTTLETGIAYSSTTTLATRNASSAISVPSALQASNTSIKFRLLGTIATGASSGATNTRVSDNISLTITYNTIPNTPSLDAPTNSAVGQSLAPTFKTTATDPNSDTLKYKIDICTDSAMTTGCNTYDQTSSTTGWSAASYASGTQAVYTLQINLSYSTPYYWRSYAIDQSGSNTWSATQATPYSFTTTSAPNTAPNLPTLVTPGTGDTGVSQTPSFVTVATDNDTDDLQYEVKICTDSGMSTGCQTFTAANTGWSNADVGTSSYSSGTTATYVLQTGNSLASNTQYFWKTRAIDPAGSNTYSSTQTTAYSFTTLAVNQNPNQPTNSTPASGTGGLSFTPTLTASAFSDPDAGDTLSASQWQVATDTGFTSIVFDTGTTGSASNTVNVTTTLNVGTTYYWRLRYQDNHSAWSSYSSYTNFTTNKLPNTPTNSTPGTGTTAVSFTPTLTASAFSDPDAGDTQSASQWQVATDTGFTSIVFDTGTTGSASNTVNVSTTLNVGTTYYWHVRYKDNYNNWSSYSTYTNFTTNRAPNTPTLTTPVNSATGVTTFPTLSNFATDPDGNPLQYRIFLALNSSFTGTTQTFDQTVSNVGWSGQNVGTSAYSSGSTASFVIQSQLSNSTTYYWKTQAKDYSGSNTWGNLSIGFSFTTVAAPNNNPNQPTNSTPASGTGGLSFTPTLTASAFSDPDGGDTQAASQWQVATDTGFSSVVFDTGTTGAASNSVNVTTTLNVGTTYYWHVRYQDNHGAWSTYSSYTNFTTNKVPNTPTNSTPGTGTTAVSFTPTLTASSFSDPDVSDTLSASQWQVATDTGFSSVVFDTGTTGAASNSVNVTTTLNVGTTYYWHVRYKDNYNNWSSYSTITSFTSGTAPVGTRAIPARFWKFDEGYGTVTHDQNGYTENLAGSSLPTWLLDGKYNKALNFPGANSGVNIGSTAGLDLAASNFSISAWVNPSNTAGIHSIFSTSKGIFYIEDGILKFQKSSASWDTIGTGFTIPTNVWSHVAIIRSGLSANQTQLYVNGYLAQTGAIADLGTGATNPAIAYDAANGRYFAGSIDDLKVYTSAISLNNLKVDYNNMSARVLGSISTNSSGQASKAYSGIYCVPGSTDTCTAPVAEWKFEEGVGTTAYDTSGNSNNAIFGGNPKWAVGKIGKALLFDGSSTWLDAGTRPSLNITNALTLESWIYLKSNDGLWKSLISKGKTAGYFIMQRSGNTALSFGTTLSVSGYTEATINSSDISTNTWYHLATTYDGSNIKMYLNGVLKTTVAASGTIGTNSSSLVLGASTTSTERWNGLLDDVRIYNYARTPSQIAYDYNKGAPVAWYKFDEGADTIIHNSSANINHGTLSIGASGTQTSAAAAWTNGAAGKFNSSLNFDGTDDYVDTGLTINNPGLSGNSYSAWIKTSGAISKAITGHSSSTAYSLYNCGGIELNGQNKPEMVVYNGTSYIYATSNSSVADNKWHHIIGVHNPSDNHVYLYVDGTLKANTDMTNSISCTTNIGLQIGKRHKDTYPGYFSGQIDDVRIYNYPLTSTQVKQVFTSGAVNFH